MATTIISQNYSAALCVSASSPGHNHMQTTTKISWQTFISTQGWKWKFFKWRQNRQLSNFLPAFRGLWKPSHSSWILFIWQCYPGAVENIPYIQYTYDPNFQSKGKTTYWKGGHGKHDEKLKNFSQKNNLNFAAISILNGESRMVGHLKEMLERSFWWEIPR